MSRMSRMSHIGHISHISLMGLMSLMCLMCLMGCSEGVAEPATDTAAPIAFAAELPERPAVVRSEPLEDYTTSFRVWGYKNMTETAGVYGETQTVMGGYTVGWADGTAATTASNSHDWEYVNGTTQTIHYWDFSAKAYRFFGVAPASTVLKSGSGPDGNDHRIVLDVDAAGSTPYVTELWLGNDAATHYGRPVTLRFARPLARVRFVFRFVEGLVTDRSALTDIAFAPEDASRIATAGEMTFTYPIQGTATQYAWTSTPGSDPEDAIDRLTEDYLEGVHPTWYALLPVSSQPGYLLSVDVFSVTKTAVVPAAYMSWQPGFQYTYYFKITEDGGVKFDTVDAAFRPWTNVDIAHEIYNW